MDYTTIGGTETPGGSQEWASPSIQQPQANRTKTPRGLKQVATATAFVVTLALGVPQALAATSVSWTQAPGGCSFLGNSDLPGGNWAIAGTYNQSSWCLASVEVRLGYKVDGYWYYEQPRVHTGEGGGISDSISGADATSGRHRSKVGGSWTTYKYTSY